MAHVAGSSDAVGILAAGRLGTVIIKQRHALHVSTPGAYADAVHVMAEGRDFF